MQVWSSIGWTIPTAGVIRFTACAMPASASGPASSIAARGRSGKARWVTERRNWCTMRR
jgi:hypothetical protein